MRKALPWIYLLLAIWEQFCRGKPIWSSSLEGGGQAFDLARFIADANSTAASRSLSADLLVGASAVTLWICVEGPRQKIKGWWLAIPLSFGVAFACAAPSFYSCENDSYRLRNPNPHLERSHQS